MKGSSLAVASVAVGLAGGLVVAMGLPVAGAQGSEEMSAQQTPGLMGLTGEANLSSERRRSTDFDLIILAETDRPLGRLSLITGVAVDDETPSRIVHLEVSADQAMDIHTITYLNNSLQSYLYVFDEYDPNDIVASIPDIRFVLPLDATNTSGVVQIDPPVRIREGDFVVANVITPQGTSGAIELNLLGTTMPGGGVGDIIAIE